VVEVIKGMVKVSTQIKDQRGYLIAELVRNEWKAAPPPQTWDKNYSQDSLEVIDPRGNVVLQVTALEDRIRLQGEWWGTDGTGTRLVKSQDPSRPGGFIIMLGPKHKPGPLGDSQIVTMFKYPSELHLGELL
jgi:hypothetical protein